MANAQVTILTEGVYKQTAGPPLASGQSLTFKARAVGGPAREVVGVRPRVYTERSGLFFLQWTGSSWVVASSAYSIIYHEGEDAVVEGEPRFGLQREYHVFSMPWADLIAFVAQ